MTAGIKHSNFSFESILIFSAACHVVTAFFKEYITSEVGEDEEMVHSGK